VGKTDLKKVLKKAAEAIGFPRGKQRSLRIDIKEKKGRAPFARAYGLGAGKAKVTMFPTGLVGDLLDLMGAFGVAEFYYNIPGDVPYEHVFQGTTVMPATYRALFQMLAAERGWLEEVAGVKEQVAAEVAEGFRFAMLLEARREAARFKFARALYADPNLDPEQYSQVMKDALIWRRVKNDANAYLYETREYDSGGIALGYVLAAQIRKALIDKLGEKWYANEALADELKRGCAKGLRMEPAELLGLWGIEKVDVSAFAEYVAGK